MSSNRAKISSLVNIDVAVVYAGRVVDVGEPVGSVGFIEYHIFEVVHEGGDECLGYSPLIHLKNSRLC